MTITRSHSRADATGHGVLAPADGIPDTSRRPGDRLSSQLPSHPYVLGAGATSVLTGLGVPADRIADDAPSRRPAHAGGKSELRTRLGLDL
jgi:hypothetical protein